MRSEGKLWGSKGINAWRFLVHVHEMTNFKNTLDELYPYFKAEFKYVAQKAVAVSWNDSSRHYSTDFQDSFVSHQRYFSLWNKKSTDYFFCGGKKKSNSFENKLNEHTRY